MTNFEKLRSISKDELIDWLDKYGAFDNAPWTEWFGKRYCQNCESIIGKYPGTDQKCKFAYCEVNDVCRFFPDMEDMPNNKETITLWLESEEKNEMQ